jgi:hypothetical protein
MNSTMNSEELRETDAAVVARYLQLRNYFHDQLLARVERHLCTGCEVQPTRRIPSTLSALVRNGFHRPGEGEIWPVVFLTAVDITLALAIQLTHERLADLGTVVNGPRPLRHWHWEDMWGWETSPAGVHERFFELPPAEQETTLLAWYDVGLSWLARNGLLKRKA